MAKTFFGIVFCLCFVLPAFAATPLPSHPVKPEWSELTPAQQQVLDPLKDQWGGFDAARRKHWVKIANRYPKMKPEEQQRLTTNIKEWAQLTPAQRQAAREKCKKLNCTSPEQRARVKSQWNKYQQSRAAKSENSDPSKSATPTQ